MGCYWAIHSPFLFSVLQWLAAASSRTDQYLLDTSKVRGRILELVASAYHTVLISRARDRVQPILQNFITRWSNRSPNEHNTEVAEAREMLIKSPIALKVEHYAGEARLNEFLNR